MKLAIFDFDGTLFKKDTLPYIGKVWLKQKRNLALYTWVYCSVIPYFIAYKSGFLPRDRFKYEALNRFHKIYKDMKRIEIEELFQMSYLEMKHHFNLSVLKEINSAREDGFHTVLLSGAYSGLLNEIAKELQVDTVIGVDLPYKKEVFDHMGEIPYINGKSKVTHLLKRFDKDKVYWQESRSYADSYSDMPVFELVGEPVAVSPDQELLEYAQKNKWRIITD